MFLWVLVTAVVKSYIYHLMLVCKARAAFDTRHVDWEIRHSQVALRRGSAVQEETECTIAQSLSEFDNVCKCKRPKQISHLDFRVKLAKTLTQRVAPGVATTTAPVCITPIRQRRQRGRPSSVETVGWRLIKKSRLRKHHVGPGKESEAMKEPACLSLPLGKQVGKGGKV